MERSSEQQWTTLLQQHRLGVGNVLYVVRGRDRSQMRLPEATLSDVGQPSDTLEYRPEALAWEAALLAQSSAYLALELQAFAERLSQTPIRCPESTYRRLFDSLGILRRLLNAMARNYRESNDNGSDGLVPVLSERMVGEIRSMLDQEIVSGSGGSTISSARVAKRNSEGVGDTR